MLPPGKSKGGVNDSAFYQITLVLVLYPVCLVVLSPTPLCRFCDEVCRLGCGHESGKSVEFVANFRDLCSQTLLLTFPVHCNGLNSIRVTQTGLSWTCGGLYYNRLDMLIEMVSVHDFYDFCW